MTANEPFSDDVPSDELLARRMEMYRSVDELEGDPEAGGLRDALIESPVWADRFDRQTSWDAAVFQVLHEVDVPAGLAERLVVRCRSDAVAAIDGKTPVARGREESPGWRRPGWGMVAAAAAVVLLVLIPTLMWIPWRGDWEAWTAEVWLREAARCTEGSGASAFRPTKGAVAGFPFDRSLRAVPRGVIEVQLAGRRAMVYRGTTPRGRSWSLAVVRVAEPLKLPSLPPRSPIQVSSGWCGAVWQNGGIVYVLRLRGTPDDYRDLVRLGSPLA